MPRFYFEKCGKFDFERLRNFVGKRLRQGGRNLAGKCVQIQFQVERAKISRRREVNRVILKDLFVCFLNGPIMASFCLFSLFSRYNFNNTNWKKCRWCAWDLNPGLQDCRRRWNHGAMVATQVLFVCKCRFSQKSSKKI